MLRVLLLCAFASVALCALPVTSNPKRNDEETRHSKCYPADKNIYDFEVETLTGEKQNLTRFRGKVLLIMNVATYCDYTEQYNDFNAMLERNPDVHILAFPCNQFHMQEPGKNHEILNGLKYVRPGKGWEPGKNVHIYGKIDVNGEKHHPLFEFLKDTCPQTSQKIGKREELFYDPIRVNDVVWNFEKFLIDRRGHPRYRFFPATWNKGQRVEQHFKALVEETD